MLHRDFRRLLLGFAIVALITLPAAADDGFPMPEWADAVPAAVNVTIKASPAQADSSYSVALPMAAVISLYQERFQKAEVDSRTSFDGLGNTISATTKKATCIIRIAQADQNTRVRVSCAPKSEPSAARSEATAGGTVITMPTEPSVPTMPRVPSQPVLQADLTDAKSDLASIQSEITAAQKIDAQYTGGLVKALTTSRIAILRQTEAMLDQKLLSYKAGAPAHHLSASDSQKLAEVESEMGSTRSKISQQQLEVARYSGGLTYALSLSTLETLRQTLALLEQRRVILKYGAEQLQAAIPTGRGATTSGAVPVAEGNRGPNAAGCLKIQSFDSSVLSTNNVFTELAWKVDVVNTCATPLNVHAIFKIFDKDDFELDSASQDVYIPVNGIGNARGRMLVSPPEKARRMTKQGASLSVR